MSSDQFTPYTSRTLGQNPVQRPRLNSRNETTFFQDGNWIKKYIYMSPEGCNCSFEESKRLQNNSEVNYTFFFQLLLLQHF